MLFELDHSFSIIGLTETKYNINNYSISTNRIPGYSFVSQPSFSNAGGAGIFVSNKLSFIVRDNLSVTTPDYACLWIEIPSDLQHKIICAVIYTHPHSNLEVFIDYINKTLDTIN